MVHHREKATSKMIGRAETLLVTKPLVGLITTGRDVMGIEKQEDQIPHEVSQTLGTHNGKTSPHNVWL